MEKERSAYHFDQDKIQMAKGNILRSIEIKEQDKGAHILSDFRYFDIFPIRY